MPCDSWIRPRNRNETSVTNMTDAGRLADALADLGWAVTRTEGDQTVLARMDGVTLTFVRNAEGEPYQTEAPRFTVNTVQRKYTEFGVRAWARKNRFAIIENDGR